MLTTPKRGSLREQGKMLPSVLATRANGLEIPLIGKPKLWEVTNPSQL